MSPTKNIKTVFHLLDKKLKKDEKDSVVTFQQFLAKSASRPLHYYRNVFQLFNNMMYHYIREEEDEYVNDPENINFKTINCDNLLVRDTAYPFFTDLPLANRLVRMADSFKEGTQQNKIYIFIGPPGSGKSTLLNNLLRRFEQFTKTSEGVNYEVLWRLYDEQLGPELKTEVRAALDEYYAKYRMKTTQDDRSYLEIPCPSHDHPILIVPREYRRELLENILVGEEKVKIFNKKEYDWVFKKDPCTICMSIYQALQNRLGSPAEIFNMLYAKRYCFNRRLGRGISVFNPGDIEPEQIVYHNEEIQRGLGIRFKDSTLVKYVFSRYANTNNGVFVLMDVKGNNEKRFLNLHGIISEGTHKIDDIEENVNSLFIAVMNPEDKQKIINLDSFKDRIKEINVNYILNYIQETKIYCSSFGNQIKKKFLPGVLNNFAKIIISSRLRPVSETLRKWIKDPKIYTKYCDENLLLLKLSIYNNKIPTWLSDEDYAKFDRKMRRSLINESELEGRSGFSGRESINIFNEFYNAIRKKHIDGGGEKRSFLITMDDIKDFFKKHDEYSRRIPRGFIDSIIRLYDYNVMQQIKESLFHPNEERISKDIQNYLFASNYERGERLTSPYTNDVIEVNDNFFNIIEIHLLDKNIDLLARSKYRQDVASRFIMSLQEMQVGDGDIKKTAVYNELYNSYIKNLRENIFQPFLEYTSFESAIKEFGTKKFEVYDNRTKEQVKFLIKNLITKFHYSEEGACQVCLYVLNNKVAESFHEK